MHVEKKKHHYACTNILSNWFLQMPADTSLVEEAERDCSHYYGGLGHGQVSRLPSPARTSHKYCTVGMKGKVYNNTLQVAVMN